MNENKEKEYSPIYMIICKLCKKSGISATKLCMDLTGSKGNLPTWQKGNIKAITLIKMADYFDCSVDYLLGRTIEENNNIPSIQINDDSISDNSTNKKNGIIIEDFTGNEFISNFIKQFSSLSYSEQLEIMNLVNKKAKAE